jgi:hypothetical protein
MYILTDYTLILTKERPDLSSERADPSETALARTSTNSKLLSSDRALQNNKPLLS